MNAQSENRWLIFLVGVFLVAVFMFGPLLVQNSGNTLITPPVVYIFLLIGGVIAFLLVIGLLTDVFSGFGLNDRNEALGLPTGSVRAIIALLLLVMSVVLTLYIFGSAGGTDKTLTGLTCAQAEALIANFGKNVINFARDASTSPEIPATAEAASTPESTSQASVTVQNSQNVAVNSGAAQGAPNAISASSAPTTTASDCAGVTGTYNVTVHYDLPQAAHDLGAQILTTFSTLTAAVAAFYFGSRTAEGSRDGVDSPGLSFESVSPDDGTPGSPMAITITGKNFDNPGVMLTSLEAGSGGKITTIRARVTSVSATSITCKFTIPNDAALGNYNISVTSGDGLVTKTLTAFGVNPPGSPPGSPL